MHIQMNFNGRRKLLDFGRSKMLGTSGVAVFLIQIFLVRFGSAILRSSDVVKPCLPLESLPSVELDLDWMYAGRDPWYVPMGSAHLFRSYAEYLRGHSAADQADLDAMNLRVSFLPTINTTGYGEWFEQTCVPLQIKKTDGNNLGFSFNSGTCISTSNHSAATDTSLISTTDDTVIWTDNASVLLITRCVQGKFGDWKLLSVNPDIPGVMKQVILNKAAEFGLDTSDYDIAGNPIANCSNTK